ncbi:MAG: hypothetical protein K2Q32_01770 [Alphaproteobacteria bacterium]|nr:hypothetical protein [Alphaproteobacteria bacterium]
MTEKRTRANVVDAVIFLATGDWPTKPIREMLLEKPKDKRDDFYLKWAQAEKSFIAAALAGTIEVMGTNNRGKNSVIPAIDFDDAVVIDRINNTVGVKGDWIARKARVWKEDIEQLAYHAGKLPERKTARSYVSKTMLEKWFRKERLPLYKSATRKGLTGDNDWSACKEHFGNKAALNPLREVRREVLLKAGCDWALKSGKR